MNGSENDTRTPAEVQAAVRRSAFDCKVKSVVGMKKPEINLDGAVLDEPGLKLLLRLLLDAESIIAHKVAMLAEAQDAMMVQTNHRTQDAILFMGDVPESPRRAPPPAPAADSSADDGFTPTAPDSYRFTPRSQRGDTEVKQTHNHHQYRYVRSLFDHQPTGEEGTERDWYCERLSLQHNQFNSLAVAHICSLLRNTTQLTALSLGSNPLGDTGAALVGRALPQCKCLRTLGLQDCGINSKGVKHLAKGCASNVSLRSLWLFANNAADEGTSHLAAALRNAPLEELGLEQNNIGVKGMQALAYAVGSGRTKLLWLRLQHNPSSGAAGAAALARALWEQPRLTKLQLRDTAIGAAGAAALSEALRQNKVLRQLCVEDNHLSPRSTEKLLQGMRAGGTLNELGLDLQHGARYYRPCGTADLRESMGEAPRLTFLGGAGGRRRT